jgi:hypothetical protein
MKILAVLCPGFTVLDLIGPVKPCSAKIAFSTLRGERLLLQDYQRLLLQDYH